MEPNLGLLGRTIAGKYRIDAFIGAGAMGAVFKAHQVTLEKTVAVKVLHRELALSNPTFAERFHREALAASRFDHPGSIRVIDFGEEPDGLLYLVMEYVDGQDLHAVAVERGPLPEARIVSILSQALAALAVAHDQGIIHRDLKPENILVVPGVDDDGGPIDTVKVCDFGIARIIDPRSDTEGPNSRGARPAITQTGFIMGTPEYMSPEQARGEPLDARSDLYSMGVVLFRLLTSQVPFQAESAMGVALKQISDEPIAPSLIASGVSPRLEAVCLRAMRKERKDRYQSARAMRAELRGAREVPSAPSLRPLQIEEPASPSAGTDTTELSVPVSVEPRRATLTSAARAMPGVADRPGVARRWAPRLAIPALLALVVVIAMRPRRAPVTPPVAAVGNAAAMVVEAPRDAASAGSPARTASSSPTAAAAAAPRPGQVEAAREVTVVAPPRDVTTARATSALPSTAPRDPAAPSAAPQADPRMEPAPTAPTPIATPTPTVTATAAPLPEPAPVATAAPAFDAEAARVLVGGVSTTSGLPAAKVRSALNHAPFTRCYRDALRAGGAEAGGTVRLHLSIDDTGHVTSASASGTGFLPGAKACLESAARAVRVGDVDTGDATADVTLTLAPR